MMLSSVGRWWVHRVGAWGRARWEHRVGTENQVCPGDGDLGVTRQRTAA